MEMGVLRDSVRLRLPLRSSASPPPLKSSASAPPLKSSAPPPVSGHRLRRSVCGKAMLFREAQ